MDNGSPVAADWVLSGKVLKILGKKKIGWSDLTFTRAPLALLLSSYSSSLSLLTKDDPRMKAQRERSTTKFYKSSRDLN